MNMKKIIAVAAVVMMLVVSSVSVMAATSPSADDVYTIKMGTSTSATSASVTGGTISASSNPVVIGEEVTLTATAKDGYAFAKWIITGDYTIVSGSLEDGVITIIPNSDITVDAEFTGSGDSSSTSDDSSSTSPKTGESATVVVIALLAACGVATVARKRISE